MSARERVAVSWSGGKDSCLMLHELMAAGGYEVEALLCMVKEKEQRVTMHGVPVELLDRQADSLGLRLVKLSTTPQAGYEAVLGGALRELALRGVRKTAYGDLFLADIRAYRQAFHGRLGLECLFPVWGRDTRAFARDFLAAGYRAIVTCVDASKLDVSYAGRMYDAAFLADLPREVDPCGENGEFHTFVFDGPRFRRPVGFTPAAPVLMPYEDPGHSFRLGFCDLIPVPSGAEA